MKTINWLILVAVFLPFLSYSQSNSVEVNKASGKIQAYYFHNAIRCETCKTVESEAKADLKELYGNEVTFQALNLEEKDAQLLAKNLKVSGQTLIIVKGEKQINLTNEGFLYAVTNPDKFKAIIKEKVDPLLD